MGVEAPAPAPGSTERWAEMPAGCAHLPPAAAARACAPWACDPVADRCRPIPCQPQQPEGSCPPGQACRPDGSCAPVTCSPEVPGGACPAGQICASGGCRALPCGPGAPHGHCPPDWACDAAMGACRPLPCAASQGAGSCPAPLACGVGADGRPACVAPRCGPQTPWAACPPAAGQAQICAPGVGAEADVWACRPPACAPGTPGGACPEPGEVCVGGACVAAACGPGQPAGACPRSQACVGGRCLPRPCAEAHPDDGGFCPAGEVCCDRQKMARGFCSAPATCVPRRCSDLFPHGRCPLGQICAPPLPFAPPPADGAGVLCRPLCGPDAPTGACPPPLACVARRCTRPCPDDQDCDTLSDADEGLAEGIDTDGDGVPDAFDLDSDGDGIPDRVEAGDRDLATPPFRFRPHLAPAFRNLDSDGDGVADRVEAGPDPSRPRDTDGDGWPDYLDLDSDGDGILDRCEARQVPGQVCALDRPVLHPAQLADSDGDGVPDMLSLDSDGDGVPDAIEARRVPHDPATLDPEGVSHHPSRLADYRNLDSDGDGVPDALEDLNGNGLVDCLVDGEGHIVSDPRPIPACGGPLPQGPDRAPAHYDFNPGCPADKCLLAETSRVHADSDGNGIPDGQEGAAQVCAPRRAHATNLFVSQAGDFALALDPAFARAARAEEPQAAVGLSLDATDPATGAWPVAGLVVRRPPLAAATGGRARALRLGVSDVAGLGELAGVEAIGVELQRTTDTYDGFPAVQTRLSVHTAEPMSAAELRERWWDSLVATSRPRGAADGRPLGRRFRLLMQTVVREEAAGGEGYPVTVAAIVNDPINPDEPHGYAYRPRCLARGDPDACRQRQGCLWEGGACGLDPAYRLPMFAAEDLAFGGAVGQYGDATASFCQPLVQATPQVDFLWAIDTSSSMADKIGQVMRASALFFPFLDNAEADYRVGMTTTAAHSPFWPPRFPGCHGLAQQACDNSLEGYDRYLAEGGCTWHEGACYPACTPLQQPEVCEAEPGCRWQPEARACAWAGCQAVRDGIDDVEGAGLGTTCRQLGCSHRPGVGCGLVGTPDLINGAIAADFTGAIAGRRDLDSPDRSVAYHCREGCSIDDGGQASCGALAEAAACERRPACRWDAERARCHARCCPACEADPDGAPNDPGCYFAARLPEDNGSGEEFGLAMAQWALFRAGRAPACRHLGAAAACQDHPGCFWAEGRCEPGACQAAVATAADPAWACDAEATPTPVRPGTPEILEAAARPAPGGCEFDPLANRCVASMPAGPGQLQLPGPAGPMPLHCRAAADAASCLRLGPRCQWGEGACVPTPDAAEVLCAGASRAACLERGAGQCAWDDCRGHPDLGTCEAVAGCRWTPGRPGSCAPRAGEGACRPPLKRMLRANAATVAVIVSDEEECALKDGPEVWRGQPNPVDPVQCRHNQGALDGSCCGDMHQGGLMAYDDPVRLARSRAYAADFAARGVLVFSLVGDAADPGLPPTVHAGEARKNGGCVNRRAGLVAEAGQGYIDVAADTGGGWSSICADDLGPATEAIVTAGLFAGSRYRLEGHIGGRRVQPIAATVQVAVERCLGPAGPAGCPGGTEVVVVPRSREDGFDFDPDRGSLAFFGRARPAPGGNITVSYRYWVDRPQPAHGSADACPCPETQPPDCACPPGTACGVAGAGGAARDLCALATGRRACDAVPGCAWNSSNGGHCQATGICALDPSCGGGCPAGERCHPGRGLCLCDRHCGRGCPGGQICDDNQRILPCEGLAEEACGGGCGWHADTASCRSPTCGQCVCDPTCGGGCATGQTCDADPASPTCGACVCARDCHGRCGPLEVCVDDPAAPWCGLCVGLGCGDCPPGWACDPGAEVCVCDPTCGGGVAGPGQRCDDDPLSPSCGLWRCDERCGAGCPQAQICDADPASPTCGSCRPDPTCGPAGCGAACAAGTAEACAALPGCRFAADASGRRRCLPVQALRCDPGQGQCVPDPGCLAASCGPFERCRPEDGTCVCDPTCGGRACGPGRRCDADPGGPTCGQCVCEVTCGGGCGDGQRCDADPSSPRCGTCQVDPSCGGPCPLGTACDPSVGLCRVDPTCGGSCPVGRRCSPLTGRCEAVEGGR